MTHKSLQVSLIALPKPVTTKNVPDFSLYIFFSCQRIPEMADLVAVGLRRRTLMSR